jgi:sec-independent protein translocase protein TatA
MWRRVGHLGDVSSAKSGRPLRARTGYLVRVGYLETRWHIVLLLVIALLLFGGKRLPEIGRSLGSGMREFKDGISGESQNDAEAQPALPPAESTGSPTAATTERENV